MADATAGASAQTGELEDLSFAALRRLGIELAQGLAAENWTDYNVHDPGVTFLEQLCYALTDLVHRTEFDVADHLTTPDGDIDFKRLGLELPEQIFPCRPTTATDYRRVMLDKFAYLEDVWIGRMEDGGAGRNSPNGLYRIVLRPPSGNAEQDEARIQEAFDAYNEVRSLCEDVQDIGFVREVACEIIAEVEVERGSPPDEILAEIYHRCAAHIASRVRMYPFEQARRADRSLDDMFTGPLGQHGFCDDDDLQRWKGAETSDPHREKKTYEVSEFFSLLNQIEGVDYARDLYFQVDGKPKHDSIGNDATDEILRLRIPTNPGEVKVRLTSHGRQLEVPFEGFKSGLDALTLKSSVTERAPQDIRKLFKEPRGEYRDLRKYTSIQMDLPATYGVGGRSVLKSERPEEIRARVRAEQLSGESKSEPPDVRARARARARQLKGYLLLFDQLMANYAANIASLRNLFSPDFSARSTYFSQPLDESQIPDLGEIYPQDPAAKIAEILDRYDNAADRKGRLLDYLLALYGESFSQNSLRAFNIYAAADEGEQALVQNKVRFLSAIVELGRDRGGAFDYRNPKPAIVSGLQLRVSYLLGFVDHQRKSLTASLDQLGLRPVPDDEIASPNGKNGEPSQCKATDFRHPDNPGEYEVPLQPSGAAQSISQLKERVGHLLPRQDGHVAEGVLDSGISLTSYRLGHLKEDPRLQAFLVPDEKGPWWRLGHFSNRPEAIDAVNELRRLIVLLNTESEGMHVVEHILLRPRSPAARDYDTPAAINDFLSLRLSVVFPAWTARCKDERFRQLAMETVRLNCPAHIVPEVLWLGFEDMGRFEDLQQEWLNRLAGNHEATDEMDAASARLVEFLIAHRGQACWALAPPSGNGRSIGERAQGAPGN